MTHEASGAVLRSAPRRSLASRSQLHATAKSFLQADPSLAACHLPPAVTVKPSGRGFFLSTSRVGRSPYGARTAGRSVPHWAARPLLNEVSRSP